MRVFSNPVYVTTRSALIVQRTIAAARLGRASSAPAARETMQAHRNIGERAGEHLPLASDFVRDLGEKRRDRTRDIRPGEQVARCGMAELLVQVQHLGGPDLYAARRSDASLNGDVRDVLVFLRGRRLDLGEAVAVVELLEYVDRNEGLVGDERRLEHGAGARVERLLRGGDARRAGVVRQVDQHAARVARPGRFAPLAALGGESLP